MSCNTFTFVDGCVSLSQFNGEESNVFVLWKTLLKTHKTSRVIIIVIIITLHMGTKNTKRGINKCSRQPLIHCAHRLFLPYTTPANCKYKWKRQRWIIHMNYLHAVTVPPPHLSAAIFSNNKIKRQGAPIKKHRYCVEHQCMDSCRSLKGVTVVWGRCSIVCNCKQQQ